MGARWLGKGNCAPPCPASASNPACPALVFLRRRGSMAESHGLHVKFCGGTQPIGPPLRPQITSLQHSCPLTLPIRAIQPSAHGSPGFELERGIHDQNSATFRFEVGQSSSSGKLMIECSGLSERHRRCNGQRFNGRGMEVIHGIVAVAPLAVGPAKATGAGP